MPRRGRGRLAYRTRRGNNAPNPISPVPTEYIIGGLDIVCPYCSALHFPGETVGSSCCHKGKVILPTLSSFPYEMMELMTSNSVEAKYFQTNIRSYNSSLAFASMGAQVDVFSGQGPFCYRIHGQIYHLTGPLHPHGNRAPSYAQLYILDSEAANNTRIAASRPLECHPGILTLLDSVLRRVNPYTSAYRQMHQVELAEEHRARIENRQMCQVQMLIRQNHCRDLRRYNAPSVSEVAAIFVDQDGHVPSNRDIAVFPHDCGLVRISPLNPNCDPMTYPLLFPAGDPGWAIGILYEENMRTSTRNHVTMLQFYSYRLAIRPGFSPIHYGRRLFQQYVVDAYVKTEGNRLNYIRQNQSLLRVELYQGLMDYIHEQEHSRGVRIGRIFILPSSFPGSSRAMQQNYQDAMAIVRKFGRPDLFVTFTCNPRWTDIVENLLPNQNPSDRPDLVARVFNLKLQQLLHEIVSQHVLGVVIARVHVVEFQKRGLPHAHMLFMLREEDKPGDRDAIDRLVCAEIPSPTMQVQRYDMVRKHMIHGPCGNFNLHSPCMSDGKCTKEFPKSFVQLTEANNNGYPRYRRRDDGQTLVVGTHEVDNRWVVPYNPYLLVRFNAHINVEVCASVKSVKYLFKYVYVAISLRGFLLLDANGEIWLKRSRLSGSCSIQLGIIRTQAAQRRGLLADDSEWDACLAEAALFQMPCQLRQLFATILIYNNPTDPVSLWTKYKGYLSEDFSRATSDAAAEQMTLRELEFQLRENRLSCHHYGLPAPLTPLLDSGEDHLDVNAELQIGTEIGFCIMPRRGRGRLAYRTRHGNNAPNGHVPSNRDIAVFPHDCGLVRISPLNPNCDPMTYPLLFPAGDPGWAIGILHEENMRTSTRNHVTMLQFYSYRLAIRPGFSPIHYGRRLFQQYVVDAYVKTEGNRLNYIRQNQSLLRVELYQGLLDYIHEQEHSRGVRIGRIFILPSSFPGFNAHINVEVCASVKSVKYLFKYVYKGHDRAEVEVSVGELDMESRAHDEIKNFLDARYVSAPEAMWRMFEYRLHAHSHTICRLAVHLPNFQSVYFVEGSEEQALENASRRRTTLTAWFQLNCVNVSARSLLYGDIPSAYVFRQNQWSARVRGGALCIGQAAQRRGLLADDSEWDACLAEAALFQMPCQLRQLFATILIYNNPTDPVSLWTKYKGYLSEDFSRATSDAAAEQMTLRELEFQLRENRLSCHHYGLPAPLTPLLDSGEDHLDVNAELQIGTEMYRSLTPDQKSIVDTIVDSLNVNPRCFFIDGPGGTGKTYVYNTLIHCVRAVGKIVIPLASTGIAATLLSGGQTVHSRFKLPIPLLENSVAAISANSSEAELIRRSSLIIWDEAPMAHYRALEIVDRLLKDIMHCDLAFGGKVVVLGGDFRQVLPVVPRASRAEIVAACIKQSKLWPLFVILRLTQNMRAGIDAQSFSQWLLKVGDGDLPTDQQGLISLPESCIFHGVDLVQEIFGSSYGDITALSQSVILTPKNTDSLEINEKVLDRLPNRSQCFLSVDSVECENVEEQNNYPTEFLNSLTPTGMPPHRLNLKIGAIVMLLRNLNPKQGLCNGTRMVIQRMRSHVLEAQILTGTKVGQTVLVPKISLAPSDTNLPFILKRRQFPLRLAFAMTINKAQGQTFARVGLLLHEPVFTHGQLYVAFSRVRTLNSIRLCHQLYGKKKTVLGLFLWNTVFDELLTLDYRNNVFPQAYADDLVVVVSGCLPSQLPAAQHTIDMTARWCSLHKLELRVGKCQAMVLLRPHGRLPEPRRDLAIHGRPIQWRDSIKVMGVRFDQRLSFHQHVVEFCAKVRGMLPRLTAAANLNFGFGYRALRTLYLQVVVPAIAYASAVWFPNLSQRSLNVLLSAQRPFLVRAFRSTSNAALISLSRVLPLDLEISAKTELYLRKYGLVAKP
ncbi:hypothetical protein LAZ67_7001779, partial [Cordylochernes scorpioides]